MARADEIDIMHNFTKSLLFVINLNVCLSLTVAL